MAHTVDHGIAVRGHLLRVPAESIRPVVAVDHAGAYEGPVDADGFTWWRIEGESGTGKASRSN